MNRETAFKEFPEIRTDRLILRQPSMSDIEWYFEYFSTPEIVWGGGEPGPKDLKAARAEFKEHLVDIFGKRLGFR